MGNCFAHHVEMVEERPRKFLCWKAGNTKKGRESRKREGGERGPQEGSMPFITAKLGGGNRWKGGQQRNVREKKGLAYAPRKKTCPMGGRGGWGRKGKRIARERNVWKRGDKLTDYTFCWGGKGEDMSAKQKRLQSTQGTKGGCGKPHRGCHARFAGPTGVGGN